MLDGAQDQGPQLADDELEKTLLSAILYDAKVIDRIGDLQAEDFASTIHGALFAAMQNLRAERQAINTLNLRGQAGLSKMGRDAIMEQIKKLSFAGELPDVADVSRQLIDFSLRRQMLDLHKRHQHAAIDASQSVPALLSTLRIEMDTLLSRLSAQGKTRLSHKEATDKMRAELEKDLTDVLVPCGIASVDKALAGGLRRGDYTVLAGRPGAGKSTIGLAMAIGAAQRGHGVLYFTPEMTTDQLTLRATSMLASTRAMPIPYERIMSQGAACDTSTEDAFREDHAMYTKQRAIFDKVAKEMKPLSIYYDGSVSLLASELQSRVKQARIDFQATGESLDLVVVDHLGKIRPTNRYKGNRVQEVAELSEAMVATGKEENVAMLVLHQLNRSVESRENKRPSLSDLRDSGAIEQDADIVAFAYREAYYLEQKPENEGTDAEAIRAARLEDAQYDLELLVAKNRRGKTGVVKLYCDVSCNLIGEAETEKDRKLRIAKNEQERRKREALSRHARQAAAEDDPF